MYFMLAFKTFILYIYIIICYRIMGKKEVGKLSIIDLIVSILIAELAALSIEDNEKSILISIVPIAVLVIIQLIFGYITLKSPKIRTLMDGNPTLLINKGKINFREMSKLRYSLDDLVAQLREQQVKNIDTVNYAVLENNGKLSVFTDNNEYPLPIIMDGVINKQALIDMKKNVNWVNNILKKKNVELNDVFYAFYTKEKTYIIKKDNID